MGLNIISRHKINNHTSRGSNSLINSLRIRLLFKDLKDRRRRLKMNKNILCRLSLLRLHSRLEMWIYYKKLSFSCLKWILQKRKQIKRLRFLNKLKRRKEFPQHHVHPSNYCFLCRKKNTYNLCFSTSKTKSKTNALQKAITKQLSLL